MLWRIWNLVWKESIQFIRDRMLAAFVIFLPILQLVLMVQATGQNIGDLRVAVLDLDRSATSRQLIIDLDNREELEVWYYIKDEEQIQELLDRGQVDGCIILPQGLAQELARPGGTAQVQVIVDGSNSVVGSVVMGATNTTFAEHTVEQFQELGLEIEQPIDLRVITYYNPFYDTRVFTIPAQLGFITYQITLAVASLGFARERELGTLEQLVVTPLSRLEMVLGKAIPALLISTLNFVIMFAVSVYFFHIPMSGSLGLLLGLTVVFIISEIGWGILISAASHTQQQAILLVFILAIVDVTFSGYLVPVKNLPAVLQTIAQVVPLYHYLIVVRGVMLKGAALATLWPNAISLLVLGIVILGVSVRGINRYLD